MRALRKLGTVAALAALAALGANPSGALAEAPDGQVVYREHCLVCHQEDGGGVPGFQPGLGHSPLAVGEAEALISFVLLGSLASGPSGDFDNVMPSFAALSDAEIAAVLSYMRGHFGNAAGAVTAAEVGTLRGGAASR